MIVYITNYHQLYFKHNFHGAITGIGTPHAYCLRFPGSSSIKLSDVNMHPRLKRFSDSTLAFCTLTDIVQKKNDKTKFKFLTDEDTIQSAQTLVLFRRPA